MTRHIALTIQFSAQTIDSEEYMPLETEAEEVLTLTIPWINEKYIIFPKVIEGVCGRVISAHQTKVRTHLDKKAEEERKRREWEQSGLWAGNGRPPEDEEGDEDGEGVTDHVDESVEVSLNGHTVGVGKDIHAAIAETKRTLAEGLDDDDDHDDTDAAG